MSLFSFVSPFYVASAAETSPGHLGRAIIGTPSPKPWVLDARRSEAQSHLDVVGQIRALERGDFARNREVLPVYALGQRRDEAMRIERTRRTLAVVLSTSTVPGATETAPVASTLVVAPLMPFDVEDRPSDFTPALRSRVEALMHVFLFPCARNDKPLVPASVIRLDHPQVLVPGPVTWEPLGIRLSDEALSLLLGTCRQIFGSSTEKELEEVRALLAEYVGS